VDTLVDYFSRVASHGWWRVAIELIFIGLVVYWAIDFLEGTRGERLFRGVLFILVVGFLILKLFVDNLQLERLQLIYKDFLLGMLIVTVAAFQPEVRRAIVRIGQRPFWFTSSQHQYKTAEELANALKDLSDARIGAIVVIEKQVALGEFIETGVRIDAAVSAELIKTIFYPGSALHDMAVIIRGDRIVAARVQLPLAEAALVSGHGLGSRHRAAIGITSGSDACCLVVSEETGGISLAENGQLTRNVDRESLQKYLANILT
jgi:diadenylate cyclase